MQVAADSCMQVAATEYEGNGQQIRANMCINRIHTHLRWSLQLGIDEVRHKEWCIDTVTAPPRIEQPLAPIRHQCPDMAGVVVQELHPRALLSNLTPCYSESGLAFTRQ